MEIKKQYAAPAVRIAELFPDKQFFKSADFSAGNIEDANEEEWTY